MAYVTPREGESPESLVNRFRASVQHSGILRELKDRRFFRSKAQKERLAAQRRRPPPPSAEPPQPLETIPGSQQIAGGRHRACRARLLLQELPLLGHCLAGSWRICYHGSTRRDRIVA